VNKSQYCALSAEPRFAASGGALEAGFEFGGIQSIEKLYECRARGLRAATS